MAALEVNSNDAFILMDLAWINAVLGESELADEMITRARSLVPGDPYVHYINGLVLNLQEDYSAALDALALAVANGYSTQLLGVDPNLVALRNTERFTALSE